MPIAAVTQAFSQYAQKTTGATSSSSSSGASAAASAQQEANETLATTKQEAAKGDHQAKLKLAKLSQNQPQESSAPASEAGKGVSVDQKA
jgi:hypothetical protein